jgi:DNA-binding response OmpR family regulator
MESSPSAPQSILLVEDNRDVAFTAAELLKLHGHQVAVAHDGQEALQVAERSSPDVVLLDLGLPRIDGWQVAKALRERTMQKRPLIIAISGYGDKASRLRSYDSGIDLHLVKPVDFKEVESLIRRYRTIGTQTPTA